MQVLIARAKGKKDQIRGVQHVFKNAPEKAKINKDVVWIIGRNVLVLSFR
jgi:hypothetical protein